MSGRWVQALLPAALLAGAALGGPACRQLTCGDDSVRQEVASPDGRLSAGLLERNCGATSGFTSYVALRASSDKFSGDMDFAVLVVADRVPVKMSWSGNDRLLLELSPEAMARVKRRESSLGTSAGEVKVDYRLPVPAR